MRAVFAVGLAALLLVATGCGREATTYDDATALATGLSEAEVACDEVRTADGATLVADQAACTSSNGQLDLYVFDGATTRDDWLQVGARLGPVAVGPNWVVTGEAADVEAAAEALDAGYQDATSDGT
jgi:hypothetical protein